jgi:hypothetical protein
MKSSIRIILSFIISFILGVVISLSNGRDLLSSLQSAFIFAIIAATIVAMLSWGIGIAVKKGYSNWVGFLLVLILNILGLAILVVLPKKTTVIDQVSK